MSICNIDLFENLFKRRDSDKIAVRYGKKIISYKKLHNLFTANAMKLSNRSSSDYVGIYEDNSIEFIIALLAIMYAGKIAVLFNFKMPLNEIEQIARRCAITLIVTGSQKKEIISSIQMIDECYEIEWESAKEYSDIKIFDRHKIVMVCPTSGTTKRSKLIPITYENLMYRVYCTNKYYHRNLGQRELIVLPFTSTIGNQQQLFSGLYIGMEMRIYDGIIHMKKLLNYLSTTQYISLVPTLLKIIIDYLEEENVVITNINGIFIAGDILSTNIVKKTKIRFPKTRLYQAYGLAEAAPVCINKIGDDYDITTVGKPINEVGIDIRNETKKSLSVGEIGEIYITGKHVISSYLFENSKDIEWLRTGDIGYLDKEGYLYLCGRATNMVKIRGNKVYLEEIEKVLMSHRFIQDVLVECKLKEPYGMIITARVVWKHNSFLSHIELKKYCAEYLEEYKIPHEFNSVTEIAKTESFKTKRL